jgi:type II restriction enzyme
MGGIIMKYLDFYKRRNLHTNENVFNYLISTFKSSIFTWDYFVDFSKVKKNTKSIEKELNILNSLLGNPKSTIKSNFLKIIEQHPNVRKVLPILIASRISKIQNTPIIDNLKTLEAISKDKIFNPKIPYSKEISDDLLIFFEMSGLIDFFVNKEVSNLIDYCKGIEVGMDTNARKNRTGTIMEKIMEDYLAEFSRKNNFTYRSQATKAKIFETWGINIELDKIGRIFDFALFNPDKGLFVFETNYYGSGGSKLKATCGEYKSLHDFLSNQGIHLIWITDGYGWTTAKTALYETFIHNDYLFNLQMIADGILDEVIL